MAKKAVYNNQHLAIYITQDDFAHLIQNISTTVPFFIGKREISPGLVEVRLSPSVQVGLLHALTVEQTAVQEVQDQFAKDHPDYESSTKTQDRRRHARK